MVSPKTFLIRQDYIFVKMIGSSWFFFPIFLGRQEAIGIMNWVVTVYTEGCWIKKDFQPGWYELRLVPFRELVNQMGQVNYHLNIIWLMLKKENALQ